MGKKRVFISPLDWGLGHATRCIPIIHELNRQGAEVIIGAERASYYLLQKEFPKNPFLKFPGYQVTYSKNGNMLWKMAKSSPKILKRIQLENIYLKEIIQTHKINGVISDNRYGLYSKLVPSVFITHQLFIQSPIGEKIIKTINKFFINKFDECWIPDYQDKEISLTGDLAHKSTLTSNVKYLGPLSRFKGDKRSDKNYDLLVIISGPEPQRTIFEDIIRSQITGTTLNALVVLGKPQEKIDFTEGNVRFVNHLDSREMEKAIQAANVIVSRSGYTTIMDLNKLGKKAVFIPTPGQTEQKYLAKYHAKLGHCVWSKQKNFDLKQSLNEVQNISGFKISQPSSELTKQVELFLETIKTY